ncbi:hypothetical protein [Flavobacterium sp. GSP14]
MEQVSACLITLVMYLILGSSRDGSEKPVYEIVFFHDLKERPQEAPFKS